jgi:hypothetical protein
VQRDNRRNELFERQDAVTKTLVVVYEVKLARALSQVALDAGAESGWFAKGSRQEQSEFVEVFAGLEFPDGRETKWVVIVDEVEAGQFSEFDALIQDGIGLTTKDFDAVAKVDEGFSEVTGVDALTTDMGFAAVGEVGDL